jgi:hypothetical protein
MLVMPGEWNICLEKQQEMLRAGPRERPCGLQMARPQEWGYLKPLEFTSHYHVPQMPDTELKDLMFALLGFGLALVPSLLSMP